MTHTDGSTEVVQLYRNQREDNPIYGLSIVERAEGRLVVIRLTKRGKFLREMEVYRHGGQEPFERRGSYSLESAHLRICNAIHTNNMTLPEICHCLLFDLRAWELGDVNVSVVPMEYRPAVELPWEIRRRDMPVGVATIIYRMTEPPRITGDETIEQLASYGQLARRVIEDFHETNEDINVEAWNQF